MHVAGRRALGQEPGGGTLASSRGVKPHLPEADRRPHKPQLSPHAAPATETCLQGAWGLETPPVSRDGRVGLQGQWLLLLQCPAPKAFVVGGREDVHAYRVQSPLNSCPALWGAEMVSLCDTRNNNSRLLQQTPPLKIDQGSWATVSARFQRGSRSCRRAAGFILARKAARSFSVPTEQRRRPGSAAMSGLRSGAACC